MPRVFKAEVEDVAITAADGAVLRAWFVQPPHSNGQAVVVLLHGVTANGVGSAGFSEMFLQRGYAVPMPDSRAHGASGGEIATYGVLEREDVRRWVAWVRARAPGCTYLLGESMGAAVGLQATAVCTLWIVQGADHGGASSVDHAEFERRVLEWCEEHVR